MSGGASGRPVRASSCPCFCLKWGTHVHSESCDIPVPPTVMREAEHARRRKWRLFGCWKGLVFGLVSCVWFGVMPEGVATAVTEMHLTLSANPCDTLQEVQRKNQDLRQYLQKLPWPKLKCFVANGVVYNLPLRAESSEPSHRPAEASLAYLAGFFDGDGSVVCAAGLSGCILKVGQSCDQAEVLMLFRETFGGSISRKGRGMGLRKPMLQWQAYGQSARAAASLLAPHSITKQKQLLLATRWPETKSGREDCKAELRALKECDSAVAGSCSWEYFAGFFDAEGCISQPRAGVSLRLIVSQKHPQVLKCIRDFLSRSLGIHATLRKASEASYQLVVCGLSDCKRIAQCMLRAGLVSKALQAEAALGLTKQNSAQVYARLTCSTGNQQFGKGLDLGGHQRARKIQSLQCRAAYLRRHGRLKEAEAKQHEAAMLQQEHEPLKADRENQQLLHYIRKIQSLHENSWTGALAQGM